MLLPNVTLAVVRQYIWRQSGEVVLHYRRKRWLCVGRTHLGKCQRRALLTMYISDTCVIE